MNIHAQNVLAEDLFFFSRAKMNALADKLHESFKTAAPFPHVVIDDFFPRDIAMRLGKSFPGIDDIDWTLAGPGDTKHTGDKHIEKVATSDEEKFPDYIRFMMMQLQSGIFCSFLDRLTGFKHLAPDPNHFGCGLHSTGNGGRLMLHIDASRHPNKDMNQLINMIYYCSPDWDPSYGGGLELWNEDATECVTTVKPLFNRMVIFYTAGKSWHGHPNPVVCPPHMRRNSMALYYYTTDKGVSDFDYSNFVRWKGVTEFDKKQPIHYVKSAVRTFLPTFAINSLAKIARKTGLNGK
ncbi:2OG-Fe(II) oxygenase [Lichenifustis flavocetrariae]|uniref:2OG-Fe(II) oxygenase n=1 Tax=Lichenifustis flavocetrariae TaxID=2949735 RepID=A0AA42CIG3_9HYPH|nr:2OG-Fe(II) oxygenase [Lichenifustis flavocetrariae]MCW6508553.1 2OG-Fe(II) oxygenase [Lichenifustis flavocetrariae]